MFTDVKNFGHKQVLDMSVASSNRKVKGKFQKFLKPILRMLRTEKKTSNNGVEPVAHLNNINLNNCKYLDLIAPTLLEALTQAAAYATYYEEYAAVICKLAKDDEFLQNYFAEDLSSGATPSYTLDCSMLKSQPVTICGCSHGYNCQQYHGEFNKYNDFWQLSAIKQSTEDDSSVPVRYVRTNNGTFFWTAEQSKLDEDLMEPVHCSSHLQPAQAQCNSQNMVLLV